MLPVSIIIIIIITIIIIVLIMEAATQRTAFFSVYQLISRDILNVNVFLLSEIKVLQQ
jgi:hypothetical protein